TGSTAPPASSTTSSTTQSSSSLLTSSTAIAVAQTDPKQPTDTYLELVKGSPLTLVVHHTSKTAVAVVASDVTQNLTQTLFQMAEATDSSEPATKTDDGKTIITVPTITTDQTLGEWKADAADSTNSLTDSQKFADNKSLKAPLILSGTQPDPSSTTSDTSTSSATPKVEGTSVTLSPNQATNAPLAKPALAKAGLAKFTTLASTTSPIVISAANIQVLTGTSQFDTGTASTSTGNLGADPKGDPDSSTSYTPGYDANASNDLVRSFDTITYLVSFNVQNNTNTNYSDIGYQVTATLPNAVTLQSDGKTPQVNGSIVNGTMYTNADGTQYSQGIMSSSISTTGQVVVPIVVQVSSAPNGLKITPTFTIKLTTASNNDTLNDDSLNQTYDSSTFSGLGVKPTVVSAAPSITTLLTKGKAVSGAAAQAIFQESPGNNNEYAWDVGATTVLAPLPGRNTGNYVGATFPTGPITYTVAMKGSYVAGNGQTYTLQNSQSDGAYVEAVAPATAGRVGPWSKTTGSGWLTGNDPTKVSGTLAVPTANTGQIYTTQPTSGQAGIGVYQSGSFTGTTSGPYNLSNTNTITNTGYTGVYNPYTYNMDATSYNISKGRPFSTSELLVRYDMNAALNASAADANPWSSLTNTLYVSSVTYDGQTVNNPNGTANDQKYTNLITPSGNYVASVSFNNVVGTSVIGSPSISGNVYTFAQVGNYPQISGIDTGGNFDLQNASAQNVGSSTLNTNFGQGIIGAKSSIYLLSSLNDTNYGKIGARTEIIMWDPSAFQYDSSRYLLTGFASGGRNSGQGLVVLYGVAKNLSTTPPYMMKTGGYVNAYNQYNWFTSASAAQATGDISAVREIRSYPDGTSPDTQSDSFGVPVTVLQTNPGYKTPAGNPLVVLQAVGFYDTATNALNANNTGLLFDPVRDTSDARIGNGVASAPGYNFPSAIGTYQPSTFNVSTGVATNVPATYWSWMGDSAVIKSYSVSSTTAVSQPSYQTTQSINIKVQGNFQGSSSTTYGGNLQTTLPVGITYKSGSSVDAQGKALPDPTITTTGSGATLQQILTWNFASVSLTQLTEVNFQALSNPASLSFNSSGLTGALTVSTVGSMWLASGTAGTDTTGSSSPSRSSSTTFQEQLTQALTLDKEVDKTAIEDGNKATVANDPASDVPDTSITYSLTVSNMTAAAMSNVNVLDVLPYNGDSRGTSLSGGYTVTKVSSSDSTVKYSTNTTAPSSSTYNESSDPATITTGSGGWSALAAVGTAPTATKAILFNIPTLNKGTTIVLTITIQPDNKQKPGDFFNNQANINYTGNINPPVNSAKVGTTVYGRDLSGFAWRDVNH
ncbi:beta strand repeat-containing protein, partial [Lactococcus hircilactis]|uniref:beta strand repeat-containing protein n=1 Tax=Lactococcus hircilactis TaxID=1494462 RepID=UPI0014785067